MFAILKHEVKEERLGAIIEEDRVERREWNERRVQMKKVDQLREIYMLEREPCI